MSRALLAIGLALALARQAPAASFTLSDAEQKAAIHAGERSTISEGFDREWRVPSGGETAVVITPFHRLANAARHAAFKNEALKAGDVARVLKEDAGRLVVWVNLRGTREDFARHYVPRLVAGEREIRASFVQNEHTASRQDDGGYLARCVYGFPVQDVGPRARVALIVADRDGHDVSRFSIDLGSMR